MKDSTPQVTLGQPITNTHSVPEMLPVHSLETETHSNVLKHYSISFPGLAPVHEDSGGHGREVQVADIPRLEEKEAGHILCMFVMLQAPKEFRHCVFRHSAQAITAALDKPRSHMHGRRQTGRQTDRQTDTQNHQDQPKPSQQCHYQSNYRFTY